MSMEMSRLHPREKNVREAKLKLMTCLGDIQKDLTEGEYLKVITEELSSEWALTAKYAIRAERHPNDPDKPGGLE